MKLAEVLQKIGFDAPEVTHIKTGKKYLVVGIGFNIHTQIDDVVYKPVYECEHEFFHRGIEDFKLKFRGGHDV